MVLDSAKPTDKTNISELPKYIRETRAAITQEGISGVSFEADVEEYDGVFLDSTSNVWRRSLANDPARNRFHGVALVADGIVKVFGRIQYDGWSLQEGQNVYVSATNLGDLQTAPATDLFAGVAVSVDSILIDSQISAAFDSLRQEIVTARNGEESLDIRLDGIDTRIDFLTLDVDTNTSKNIAHDEIEAEVITARGGETVLNDRLVNMESDINTAINTTDVNQTEIQDARGTALTLDARLNNALNPDGTIKSTITVSTFVQEAAVLARVSDTTFSVEGDKTAVYNARRKVRFNGTDLSAVTTSLFPYELTKTLVTISNGVIPGSLSTIEYGMNPDELPVGLHSELLDVLGADDSDGTTTKNRHISNAQAKAWTDGIAAKLNADAQAVDSAKLGGVPAGNLVDNIPISNEQTCVGLWADMVRGYWPTNAASGDTIVQRDVNGSSIHNVLDFQYAEIRHSQTTRNNDTVFYSGLGSTLYKNSKEGIISSLGLGMFGLASYNATGSYALTVRADRPILIVMSGTAHAHGATLNTYNFTSGGSIPIKLGTDTTFSVVEKMNGTSFGLNLTYLNTGVTIIVAQ